MKPRVLLVEDNEANRYLATFLLESQGIEVIHAGNGREGVTQAVAVGPHLIVMDLEMPEMDGYEAAVIIRKDDRTRGIPIVAATSHAMAADRARALALGFADYIEKPFDPLDFIQRIRRFLPVSPI